MVITAATLPHFSRQQLLNIQMGKGAAKTAPADYVAAITDI